MTTIVLAAISVGCFLLFLVRRRARLRAEEE
jgi:hypothetical protein